MLKNLKYLITNSYWLKSGTLALVTKFLLMLFGFASFLILIRLLDKESYGNWAIFMVGASIVETVRIGFLRSPLMVLRSDNTIDVVRLYSTSLFLNLLCSLLFIIILFCSLHLFGQFVDTFLFGKLLVWYALKLLIISFSDHFDLVQESNFSFSGTFVDHISRGGLFIFLIVFFIYSNEDISLVQLVQFQIYGAIVGLILTFLNAKFRSKWLLSKVSFSVEFAKRYISLGRFTFGSSLISLTTRNLDSWFIGFLISPAAVTIYNPAIRITNVFELPSSALNSVLFPKMTMSVQKDGILTIKRYYQKSVILLLIIMTPAIVLIYFFAEQIINIVAGEGFEETVKILQLIVITGLLVPINRLFNVVMESIGKPNIGFFVILLGLIINVVFQFNLISQYGLRGSAYATIVTFSVVFLCTQFLLRIILGFNVLDVFRFVFKKLIIIRKNQ